MLGKHQNPHRKGPDRALKLSSYIPISGCSPACDFGCFACEFKRFKGLQFNQSNHEVSDEAYSSH